jgi:hypothetical protein
MNFFLILFFVFLSTFALASQEYKIITATETGGYMIHARLVAKHLPKYLSSSSVTIRAIPGASGVIAMNHMFNRAKQDGTEIGHIDQRAVIHGVLNRNLVNYKPDEFTWLSATADVSKNPIILFGRKNKKLIVGSESSLTQTYASFINEATYMNLEEITGYENSSMVRLAFERNEITGAIYSITGVRTVTPQWLTDPSIEMLLQIGNGKTRNHQFPLVPTLYEKAKDDMSRDMIDLYELMLKIDRPFFLPPNVSKEQAQLVRTALDKMFSDKDYLQETKLMGIEVSPIPWETVHDIMISIVSKLSTKTFSKG